MPDILGGYPGDGGIEKLKFAEFFQEVTESFHWVLVVHVIEDSGGGKTNSHPVGSPNLDDSLGNFDRETASVGHGAAIRVGPMVGAAAEELVEEITIRVMDFHTVEPSFFGEFGSVDIFGNDSGNFGDFEGPWGDVIDHLFSIKDLSFGSDGGGGDRKNSFGLKAWMRDATDVPELKEDAASSGMNGLDDFFPSGDLFRGVDAGSIGVPVAEWGD